MDNLHEFINNGSGICLTCGTTLYDSSHFIDDISGKVARASNPLSALTPAQLAAIRAVILEVIDDHYWTFYENDLPPDPDEPNKPTEIANMHRLLFCDAVAANIVARGAPATVRGGMR